MTDENINNYNNDNNDNNDDDDNINKCAKKNSAVDKPRDASVQMQWRDWPLPPTRNMLLPHVCYPAEFGRSRSNGTSVIKQIRLRKKIDPRVQPFNVTQGHLNGQESIRHPGLPINVP